MKMTEERMGKSNAERQRKFRQNHIDDTCRLDMRISVSAFFALKRLAKSAGVTKKKFIENLLLEIEDKKLASMTDAEVDEYLDTVTR